MAGHFTRFVLIVLGLAFFAAAAHAAKQAIVTKCTIYPGQTIERSDLKAVVLVRKPLIRYRFVQNVEEVVGRTATKTILPGRFIAVTATKAASLIKAGAKTRIKLSSGSLSITLTAIALTDGGAGEEVKFRNPSSGKVFWGFVRSDGTVVAQTL